MASLTSAAARKYRLDIFDGSTDDDKSWERVCKEMYKAMHLLKAEFHRDGTSIVAYMECACSLDRPST